MEFWLDTVRPESVAKASKMGLLKGVTTNPQILGSVKSLEKTLNDLLASFDGPLAVQVLAEDHEGMILEGKSLYDFSPDRIIVKVPVTEEGLKAIHALSSSNIPIMGTVIFSPYQALLAAKAGADYVALYLSRLEKARGDSVELLKATWRIFQNYKLETKILGASIGHVEQVEKCAELGIQAVTMKEEIFEKMIEDHPLTLEACRQFEQSFKAQDASLFHSRIIA